MEAETEIRFNGELRKVRSRNVEELLAEFNLKGKRVAVELNRQILPRSSYAETSLTAGDSIEIVQFVGGG